jgi:hypothetical protein
MNAQGFGGGGGSVADATETTAGKIRIATSAEAATGTSDIIAMTPLTVKEVVDASKVGVFEYQTTFNATAGTPSIANAEQGDVYIIGTAGTIYGKDWNVGDHLIINADMGGTVTNSKIDKVDNTDNDASETVKGVIEIATNAEAGAGTATDKALVPSNVSSLAITSGQVAGLATVATSGAYSDLSGTPTLATVATSGAYSDLSGTPTLGTASALDEGEDANNLVQLDGSARLPAVDGSQLTNLPSASDASETVKGVIEIATNTEAGAGTATDKALVPSNVSSLAIASGQVSGLATVATSGAYSDLSGAPTLGTASAANTGDFLASTAGLNNLSDVAISSISNGQVISYNSTSGDWENSTPASGGATDLDGLSDVTITTPASGNLLQHNGSGQFVNVAKSTIDVGSFNDDGTYQPLDAGLTSISGLTTSANKMVYTTASDTYAVADLTSAGRALLDDATASAQRTTLGLGSAALLDEGEDANNLVQLDGSARLPAVDGSQLTNLPSASDASETVKGIIEIATNAEAGAGTATDKALVPSNVSSLAITSGQVSGLATVATSGAYSDLSGTPTLATVATSGAYADLSGTPTLLSAVVDDSTPQLGGDLDVNGNDLITTSNANLALAPNGTGYVEVKGNTNPGAIRLNCESNSHGIQIQSPPHSATATYNLILPTGVGIDGQVLKTDGGDGGDPDTVQLSWVDQASGGGGWTYSSITADPANAQAGYHYSCTGTFTITLPTSGVSSGEEIRIKNMGTGTITIDPQTQNIDGSTNDYVMDVQYSSITLVSTGTHWEVI